MDAITFLHSKRESLIEQRDKALQEFDKQIALVDDWIADLGKALPPRAIKMPDDTVRSSRSHSAKGKASHLPVGTTKTTSGEFAGMPQKRIVETILRRAPNFTLHIDQIISEANKAGCDLIRQSVQSMMSRHKELFKPAEAGTGTWTLVNPPSVAESQQHDENLNGHSNEHSLALAWGQQDGGNDVQG